MADLKTTLESDFKLDTDDYSSTAYAGTIQYYDKTATLTITIKGNNTFASDVTPKYSEVEKGKSVKTVITITADKIWNNQN
ncbi:hypothetical protein EPJ79_09670 [Brachyspira aalborgi]|uniref:Uncharacterized protein n=1 Tax=Brachyspira aalborgi TaxID=29522 RepID=A0A5C8DA92_9SPIR|nr:hypothetical protein [Brachyspira aalborgi]TXJ21371.1 hypothetical protein EPJ79_09670 [Brachyspira aalborgi]